MLNQLIESTRRTIRKLATTKLTEKRAPDSEVYNIALQAALSTVGMPKEKSTLVNHYLSTEIMDIYSALRKFETSYSNLAKFQANFPNRLPQK